nr:MAG TPA: hypothetical protein [Bacteriophage sp.]
MRSNSTSPCKTIHFFYRNISKKASSLGAFLFFYLKTFFIFTCFTID